MINVAKVLELAHFSWPIATANLTRGGDLIQPHLTHNLRLHRP